MVRTPNDVLDDRLRTLLRETALARGAVRNIAAPLVDRLGCRLSDRGDELRARLLSLQGQATTCPSPETWAELYATSLEVDSFVEESLMLVAGAAYREIDPNAEYDLADALVDELLKTSWASFVVPGRAESFRLISASVTARFPLSFWDLPILAHEVAHIFQEQAGIVADQELAETTDLHWMELSADSGAAYLAGPAFAWACVEVAFDPLLAEVPSETHPGTTARVRAACDGLARLTGASARIEEQAVWDAWCALVERTGQMPPERLQSVVSIPFVPVQCGYEGWTEAGRLGALLDHARGDGHVGEGKRIVDILNGAWAARNRYPEKVDLIAVDARSMCERLLAGVSA